MANNYVLGRGKLYWDAFADGVAVTSATRGSGEIYFGNTPELSLTSESESLDHFSSDAGVKEKDDSVLLQINRSGSFVCDNISSDNLALYFTGQSSVLTQLPATGLNDTFLAAARGRFYQLGMSPTNPSGLRRIATVSVFKGAGFTTPVPLPGNFTLDFDRGFLYIEPDSPLINGEDIKVTFDVAGSKRDQIISKSKSIYGALRYISDNPKGINRDIYLPYVKLAPDGDYNLKGDEWQQVGFSIEVLKKGAGVEAVYIDGQAVAP